MLFNFREWLYDEKRHPASVNQDVKKWIDSADKLKQTVEKLKDVLKKKPEEEKKPFGKPEEKPEEKKPFGKPEKGDEKEEKKPFGKPEEEKKPSFAKKPFDKTEKKPFVKSEKPQEEDDDRGEKINFKSFAASRDKAETEKRFPPKPETKPEPKFEPKIVERPTKLDKERLNKGSDRNDREPK